jgi:hypothetical protein
MRRRNDCGVLCFDACPCVLYNGGWLGICMHSHKFNYLSFRRYLVPRLGEGRHVREDGVIAKNLPYTEDIHTKYDRTVRTRALLGQGGLSICDRLCLCPRRGV